MPLYSFPLWFKYSHMCVALGLTGCHQKEIFLPCCFWERLSNPQWNNSGAERSGVTLYNMSLSTSKCLFFDSERFVVAKAPKKSWWWIEDSKKWLRKEGIKWMSAPTNVSCQSKVKRGRCSLQKWWMGHRKQGQHQRGSKMDCSPPMPIIL